MNHEQTGKVAKIIALRVLADGSEVGRSIHCEKTRITVGRDAYADVRLQDSTISRNHLVIYRTPDEFVLHDRSSNGTVVNGKRVMARALEDKDVITIGPYEIAVEVYEGAESSLHEHAMAQAWTADDARTLPASALA